MAGFTVICGWTGWPSSAVSRSAISASVAASGRRASVTCARCLPRPLVQQRLVRFRDLGQQALPPLLQDQQHEVEEALGHPPGQRLPDRPPPGFR
jgi:hypothetical protein